MRKVTIRKPDFDEIVYPMLAQVPLGQVYPQNPSKQEQARRQLYKLLDALEAGSRKKPGAEDKDYPLYELEGIAATFELDDAQADVLHDYLSMQINNISPVRARKLEGLLKRCKEGDPEVDKDTGVSEQKELKKEMKAV